MRKLLFSYFLFFNVFLIFPQNIKYKNNLYMILSDSTVSLVSYGINSKNNCLENLLLDSLVVYKKKNYKVARIDGGAFQSNGNTSFFNSIKQVSLPMTLTEISSDVFCGQFNSLQIIQISKKIQKIGKNVFSSLPSLTEVHINGVTNINDWCFSINPSLSQVILDSCIHVIGKNAFYKCTRLNTINLNYVRHIDEHAFESTAMQSLNIPYCNIIGEFAFADCRYLDNIIFSDNLQIISDFAFYNNSSLKSLYIPSGAIGESSFMGCTSLNNVVLSDRIESIGQAAFFGCSALNDISLPSSITRIEAVTFMDCINLKSITLPNSLTFIGESAFENSGLEEVIVPANVKEIQNNAFRNCDQLKKIIVLNPNIVIGDNAFDKNVFIEFSK